MRDDLSACRDIAELEKIVRRIGDEIEQVAHRLITEEGPKTQTRVAEILEELRE